MTEGKTVKKVFRSIPEGKRSVGNPRKRWLDKVENDLNPLAYTDVSETAGLASSINTQLAVRRNSETNPTSQHNRGMY